MGLVRIRAGGVQQWASLPRSWTQSCRSFTGRDGEKFFIAAVRVRLGLRAETGYLMTTSARARIDGGIVRPRDPAVLRLTTSSNPSGLRTGKSTGFAPLRIFPAY